MKLMIASDIHGSSYYCRKMIEAYRQEEADRLLLLGDLLYHGPRNNLPRDYNPKEVISMLNEIKYKHQNRCLLQSVNKLLNNLNKENFVGL